MFVCQCPDLFEPILVISPLALSVAMILSVCRREMFRRSAISFVVTYLLSLIISRTRASFVPTF